MGSVITIGLAASFLNNLTIENAVVDGDHCNSAAFNSTLREMAFNGGGGYSDKQMQLLKEILFSNVLNVNNVSGIKQRSN